jgi:hypothetical protein
MNGNHCGFCGCDEEEYHDEGCPAINGKKYAALFVREDSAYKDRPQWDAYDVKRDATTYTGGLPIVAHPPCRAWGVMSHMAFRNKDWSGQDTVALEEEKKLALVAIDMVRKNGGILEHPAGSKLFGSHLPEVGWPENGFCGYSVLIDQFDFGHVAHKPTKLYICGVDREDLPPLPPKNMAEPARSITGFTMKVHGRYLKRCTQYQREYTPEELIDWFELVLDRIGQ